MSETQSTSSGIQVIARAGEVLRELQASPGGLTQAELSERLGLARTTVHRILSALEQEGWAATTGRRGRYRIGPEISRMAASARRDIVDRLRPYLQEISKATGETVELSVFDGGAMIVLDQVVAPARLQAVSEVGASVPAYACAAGKASLATLTAAELEVNLALNLESLTPATIVTRPALHEDLRNIRRSGFAIDREECCTGLSGVGAVVTEHNPPPMAISILVPTARFHHRESDLGRAILDVTQGIRADLGIGPR